MIRKYIESDISKIVEIESKTINTTLGSDYLKDELNNEMANHFVYELDNDVIGYISTHYDGDVAEIMNICVNPTNQNNGIGSKILEFILDYYKDASSIILEVRKSNERAIHVYEKYGFKLIHVRKNYYSNNEDALVMQRLI